MYKNSFRANERNTFFDHIFIESSKNEDIKLAVTYLFALISASVCAELEGE